MPVYPNPMFLPVFPGDPRRGPTPTRWNPTWAAPPRRLRPSDDHADDGDAEGDESRWGRVTSCRTHRVLGLPSRKNPDEKLRILGNYGMISRNRWENTREENEGF